MATTVQQRVGPHDHSISDVQGLAQTLATIEAGNDTARATLVFRPGGTVSASEPNVYITAATLEAAALLISGPKVILFDNSITSPIVIPAGTYTGIVEDAEWWGKMQPSGAVTTVELSEGASFTMLPLRFRYRLNVRTAATATVPFILSTPGASPRLFLSDNSILRTTAGAAVPAIRVTDATITLVIRLMDGSELAVGGVPAVIDVNVAGATLNLNVGEGANVPTGAISGVVGAIATIDYISSSATISAIQAGFLGTLTVGYQTKAASEGYDDSAQVPTLGAENVQEAIDTIKPAERAERFTVAGPYIAGSFIDGVWFNRFQTDIRITGVTLWNETAGVGGDTIADILVDSGGGWVSIWAVTPANRPTLNFADGNDAQATGGLADDPLVPSGAKMRMDLTSVQAGAPANLVVQVNYRRADA